MTATQPDLYQVLGVSKDAELAEIRSAHRKLVLKCHPDKVQDPTLKAAKQDEFQKVQQAYEVLSSEKERRRYDESVRLAELKAQMQNRANVSAARSPNKFDIKITSEVRPSKMSSSPGVKSYPFSPSSSYEERPSRSRSRYYDEPRHSKRAPSHADKSYRRESEREKEREKERERERAADREREKERDRERRRKEKKEKEAAEEARRQEKAMKKEKKEREKQRTKDIRKDTEEKRQTNYDDIYVEEEELHPHLEKKKSSSSRKHDERRERERTRERSARRDEPTTPRGSYPEESSYLSYARDYIRRTENSSGSYYVQPPAPSPPNASKASPYPPPEDETRRGSTKPRRGSMDTPRERTYHKSSREHLDSRESGMSSSPPKYSKPSARGDPMPSPPSLNRTATMPMATPTSAGRPTPVSRAHTFDYAVGGESPANRGRGRSKHEPQYVLEESESEDEADRRHRHDRKSRSSKKHRSPELGTETRYHLDSNGRTKVHSYGYSSRASPEEYSSYYTEYADRRPSLYSRDSGYGTQYRVKTSKTFTPGDVAYSSYTYPSYGEEHPATAMA